MGEELSGLGLQELKNLENQLVISLHGVHAKKVIILFHCALIPTSNLHRSFPKDFSIFLAGEYSE